MAAIIDVANLTLVKLGQAAATSLEPLAQDDTASPGVIIASVFDTQRDFELRASNWHFAKARQMLGALSEAPAFEFTYQYQLPTDFLRLIRIGDFIAYPAPTVQNLYEIEGRRLMTNLPPSLPIKYIRREVDSSLWDPCFVEMLACRLALTTCERITGKTSLMQQIAEQYATARRLAIRANAIERPAQAIADGEFMGAR